MMEHTITEPKPLRISDLIKLLQRAKRKEGDLPVICTCYSDFAPVTDTDVSVIEAVPVAGSGGAWMMRDHHSLWNGWGANRTRKPGVPLPVKVLHFEGN